MGERLSGFTEQRGRAVTIGDGFFWLDEDTADFGKMSLENEPTLVIIESIRAMQEVFKSFGLDSTDGADIFYGNAARLFGFEAETEKTHALYRHAKERIPGGVYLLSKQPERIAPDVWPAYFREARGCEVWDLDGRRYFDLSMSGLGACILGYRDPDVTEAVVRRVRLGSMSTLNPPEEVELADLLCELHPWAEQVRLARTGGEIGAVAVRISRATTDRSHIAVCGYHGWHDWHLAAVVMEPARGSDSDPEFLDFVREKTHSVGALLIFDEITLGFRLCTGGAHLRLGVNPDLAIFAKALGMDTR